MEEIIEEAKEIGIILREKHKTLSTAESCTGGNIAHYITSVAGSSDYFVGGVVSYSNEVKMRVLGVKKETLDAYGAVSQPVVEQMAEGVVKLTGADYGVSTSGVAGPGGGTAEKPVGTVWMAVSDGKQTLSRKYHFGINRIENIKKATETAFFLLKEFVGK